MACVVDDQAEMMQHQFVIKNNKFQQLVNLFHIVDGATTRV